MAEAQPCRAVDNQVLRLTALLAPCLPPWLILPISQGPEPSQPVEEAAGASVSERRLCSSVVGGGLAQILIC